MPENVKETMLTYVQESPEAVAANIENSEAADCPAGGRYLKGVTEISGLWPRVLLSTVPTAPARLCAGI